VISIPTPSQVFYSDLLAKTINGFQIDAFVTEDHHSQVHVTEFPVEDGSSINDNTVEMPDEFTITGVIGPIAVTSTTNSLSSPFRVQTADQYLYGLKHSRQLLTVVSGLRVYNDMIITDYRVNRNKDNGKGLVFDMIFKQIIYVTSQIATINPNILGGSANLQNQAAGQAALGGVSGSSPSSGLANAISTGVGQASAGDLIGGYKTIANYQGGL
jgi:hypothetical protein